MTLKLVAFKSASSYLNIMDYSAHADGVTDDSDHVAAGMAAAVSAGKQLYFPAATYLLSSPLVLTEAARFLGPTNGTAWLKGGVRPRVGNQLIRLKIGKAGDYFGQQDIAENSAVVSDLYVYDCTFYGAKEYATNGGQIWFSNGMASNILFKDSHFLAPTAVTYDASNFVLIGSPGTVTQQIHDIAFQGCHFETCARTAFECYHEVGSATYDYPTHHVSLDGCVFEGAGNQGISFAGLNQHHVTITDTEIWDANMAPIADQGTTAIEINNVRYSTVTGNTVGRVGYDTHFAAMLGQWAPYGIVALNNIITGNTFDGRRNVGGGSFVVLKSSTWQFNNNIVYTGAPGGNYGTQIARASNASLNGNSFTSWDSDAAPPAISTQKALTLQNATDIAFTDNHFYSKHATAPVQCTYASESDGSDPAGYSTAVFTDCTYHRLTGKANIDFTTPNGDTITDTNPTVVEIA